MTAAQETQILMDRLERRGIRATLDQVNTLRRAELTLHRWYELECGDGNQWASWAIERDEDTDVPYLCTYPNDDRKPFRERIPDREYGAKDRVAKVCEQIGAFFYVQGDPRGCVLYVSAEPMTDSNYSSVGMAVTA